jgi:hypothetical protein
MPLFQSNDFDMIDRQRSLRHCCANQFPVETGIIELTVRESDASGRCLQTGKPHCQRFGRKVTRPVQASLARQQVVQLHAGRIVPALSGIAAWRDQPQGMNKMRRPLQKPAPFLQSLRNQPQMPQVAAAKKQLQIANPAMNQLGRTGAGSFGKIVTLYESHRQPRRAADNATLLPSLHLR